jgi:hypothetical protein
LHRFERYTGGVGRADPDRKVNFCFEGDVDGTDIITVPFDPNQLGLTPYVNVVSSLVHHSTLLKADPTEPMVGPFTSTDAGVHTIRTRSSMFVPFELVTMLMGKDYTVGEAFEFSYTLLEVDGLDGVCAAFLELLQAASTQPSEENARPVTLQDETGLAHRPIRPAVI